MNSRNYHDKKGKPHGIWAICDQGAVSALNFLTIAIGASLLSLPEQAKLVYLYTAYISLVLFNAAALFSAAPMMRAEVSSLLSYQRQLLHAQIWIAPIGSLIIVFLLLFVGPFMGWSPSMAELGWVIAFLLLQQLADFNRRSDYVFGTVKSGAQFSLLMLAIRLMLLLTILPESAELFFMLMAISSLPGAVAALVRGRGKIEQADRSKVFHEHIRLARWNIMNAPLQWSALHLPILLAGMLIGANAAAILATIRSLSSIANVFLELMETYVPVWMLSKETADGASAIRKSATRLLFVGSCCWLVAALMIVLFGELFLTAVFGVSYGAYWPLLSLLWFGNLLYFAGRIIGLSYRIVKLPVVEFAGSVGGIFVLLLCLPLLKGSGVYDVAWVIVASQVAMVLSQYIYGRRRLNS